jgi:hypothetical protein
METKSNYWLDAYQYWRDEGFPHEDAERRADNDEKTEDETKLQNKFK